MKTIFKNKSLGIVLSLFMVFGCSDFTDVELPKTQLTGPTVFEDDITATAALSYTYAQLRELGMLTGNPDGLSMLLGLYTDELVFFGSTASPLEGFYNHNLIPTNTNVSALWTNSYNQIYTVNALLEGLQNSTNITEDASNRLQGEALFIRALFHFYLINLFGDIPYIDSTDYQANSQVNREPIASVYDQIIDDLERADQFLSFTYVEQDRVRVNKGAVQSLLARIYLYKGDWALAETYATSVINQTGLYSITPNLEGVFLKNSPSTIWQLHPGIIGANTLEGKNFIFISGPPNIAALSTQLVEAFEDTDLRKEHWIRGITDGTSTWYHPYKYKLSENTGASQEYSVMFRLEEQVLIRAEARARQDNLDGASIDLNLIRNRAGLSDADATTQSELIAAILKERQLELFTEVGHRWFDLKRNNVAQEVLEPIKPAWQSRNLLFPLPESELILNQNLLPQNTGY